MNLQEFFEKTLVLNNLEESYYSRQSIRPRIVCKDGTSLSVQASRTHYCKPRYDDCIPYFSVEVGFPSIRPPEEWREYFDGRWQKLGLAGYIKRIWKDKSSIYWNLKHLQGLGRWRLKQLLSFKDNATDSVYGYVPVELVEDFINSHGGIDEEVTFKPK
jgi:hypothetical protein